MSADYGTRVPLTGLDGNDYTAVWERGRAMWPGGREFGWTVYRAGGLSPVTRGATLEAATERLADFHRGETCGACGHVHPSRDAHICRACGASWTRGKSAAELADA